MRRPGILKREEEKRRQEEKKRKAELERKAQEEKQRKEKEEEQFSAFLAVVCRNKDQQEGLSTEEYICRKQAEADSMEELLGSSDEAFSLIAAAREQKNALESEEKDLRTARGEMGIFSFKGKKQIDAKLEENAQKRKQKEQEIAGYVEGLGGYETKAQLQTALNEAKKLLRHLKRWGERESDKSTPSLSFSDAVRLYRTDRSMIKRLEEYPWVDSFMGNMLLRGAKTGGTVFLGRYRQSGSKETPIEWRVLSKEGTRLLLISKDILDCHIFQDDLYKNVWRALTVDEMNQQSRKRTWEKCELRQWLNDSFFCKAFSAEEQKLIQTVTVPAVKNRINMDHPGHDTRDNVFLLNIPEAEQYFKSNGDRKAEPCKLVADSKTLDWYGGGAWWLRSQGDNNNAFTACVYSDGRIGGTDHFNGGELADEALGIRPCIWVDVEKLET